MVLSWIPLLCLFRPHLWFFAESAEAVIRLTTLPQRGIWNSKKTTKPMKALIKKYFQNSSAMLIICIAVYGIACAQQVGCSSTATNCNQSANRFSVGYNTDNSCRTSPSHHLNSQRSLNTLINCSSAEDTCCETDHCDEYSQATYVIPSLTYGFCPLQKTVSPFDAGNNSAQTTFEPFNLPPSLNAVPIYILTRSIIC